MTHVCLSNFYRVLVASHRNKHKDTSDFGSCTQKQASRGLSFTAHPNMYNFVFSSYFTM
jgi:hypothetical protein